MSNKTIRRMTTAKELFDKMLSENDEATTTEMMIAFARIHVEEALKQAAEKAELKDDMYDYYGIDKDSILTAYDLNNIK